LPQSSLFASRCNTVTACHNKVCLEQKSSRSGLEAYLGRGLKRGMLVGLVAVSLLPLPFFVQAPHWGVAPSVWLYVSAVMGYTGLVLLLWMYILGTKSVMGLYFGTWRRC
jgi:hypothetical protein